MSHCWMAEDRVKPPCFIQLGRYGDIILLMPAFREVWKRTGLKPVVIVSTEYCNVFDGVSYVKAFPVNWHWYGGIPQAKALADREFGGGILPQWWQEDCKDYPKGPTILQCHGFNWGIDINKWPNFMTSMWDRCGFTVAEMLGLPLVFDQRAPDREARLIKTFTRNKPMLLLCWSGNSSPFPYVPEIMAAIQKFRADFTFVDLSNFRAHRIFDLLGLFDTAAGLITIDTALLHLAHGSTIPYVALTVDGWTGSVPRGNVQLSIPYSESVKRADEIVQFLNHLKHGNYTRNQPLRNERSADSTPTEGSQTNMAIPALA